MSARPRICAVSYYLPPAFSGAGRQALTIAERMRADCDIMFVAARHDRDAPATDDLEGMKVVRLGGLGTGQLFAACFAVGLAWWLWRWRDRYDVVHAHGYPPFYFLPLAVLRLLRKPNLYTMSMLDGDDPATLFAGRLGWLRRRTYRWIDVKVATSVAMQEQCRSLPARVVSRFQHIPYGVDIERFRPATEVERHALRQQFSLAPDQPVALFVGAIVERKGVEELLRAWAIVVRAVPGARLWLIGPTEYPVDGRRAGAEYVAHVKRLAAELVIADAVTFLGECQDVEVFMRNADVFCLASKQEGLPIVFLEALASGTPIVAFEVGGAQDTVLEGETGYRVPAGSVEAFARCVTKILRDESLRQRMGETGRALARKQFSLETVASQYLALYRELADRGKDGSR